MNLPRACVVHLRQISCRQFGPRWVVKWVNCQVWSREVGKWGAHVLSLVQNPEILVRLQIPLVMVDGGVDSYGLERGLFPRRDNVPSYPALGEVVERREALRQQERGLKGRRRRDPEREVLGHGGHGGDGYRRVRHGPLRRAPDAIVQRVLVRVVPAVRVREEQGVDPSSLEQFREVDPVLQVSLGG